MAITYLTTPVLLLLLVTGDVRLQSTAKSGDDSPHNSTPADDQANAGTEDVMPEKVVEKEVTESERAGLLLFDKAMEILNDSKPDRPAAFWNLNQAALMGHVPSQELVARAHLFGDEMPLDLKKSATMFKTLAANGNPTAQMVRSGRSKCTTNCHSSSRSSI